MFAARCATRVLQESRAAKCAVGTGGQVRAACAATSMLASYPSASINNLLEAARTAALVDALQQLAVEAGCTRLDLWRSEDGSFISVSLQHSRVTPVTSKLRMDTRSNHVDRASLTLLPHSAHHGHNPRVAVRHLQAQPTNPLLSRLVGHQVHLARRYPAQPPRRAAVA